ncbi:MAG TPA: nucleotidyltransferase domain-containing protein [Terriglobia bacterium]|nr:nucleotidyltransferase domain-containing protein [Terriglobia bacterium]
MNSVDDLRANKPTAILFECLAGSRAYGTGVKDSDEDIRGVFAVPAARYLDLTSPADQLSDDRGNIVYYSLRSFVELLTHANPNILELLFMPDDCVRKSSPEFHMMVAHQDVFISKQYADTHAGYAMAQIKKAKGQNKWINNPKPETAPSKEDFCFVIPWPPVAQKYPGRPLPLRTIGWSLNEYHAARLEHSRDIYRLYHYGANSRGVFRGDMIVCESIAEEDESDRFAGLLLYNENAWKQALSDHHNYWAWRRERNEARWQQQERGELDFDSKNMMHTVRLLLSGRSLMKFGRPIVRFSGEDLALLMSIREGRLSFDEIMSIAKDILADCERLKATAGLPDVCDAGRANALLREVTEHWENRMS